MVIENGYRRGKGTNTRDDSVELVVERKSWMDKVIWDKRRVCKMEACSLVKTRGFNLLVKYAICGFVLNISSRFRALVEYKITRRI